MGSKNINSSKSSITKEDSKKRFMFWYFVIKDIIILILGLMLIAYGISKSNNLIIASGTVLIISAEKLRNKILEKYF